MLGGQGGTTARGPAGVQDTGDKIRVEWYSRYLFIKTLTVDAEAGEGHPEDFPQRGFSKGGHLECASRANQPSKRID